MPKIRLAERPDAPMLRELEQDAGALFLTFPGLEHLADSDSRPASEWCELIDGESVWVAEDRGGSALGFLAARHCEPDLFIVEMSVRRQAQGRGVGRALMETAHAHARARACRAVTLTTFRNVPWNAPAYARLGYRQLPDEGMPGYLQAILDEEAAEGFIRNQRCAMELVLD
jgi:GNAT superfamily N-acetyltransferase